MVSVIVPGRGPCKIGGPSCLAARLDSGGYRKR